MTAYNTTHIIESKRTNKKFLTGFIVGFIILLLSWLTQFYVEGFSFSFSNISAIHNSAPVLWIIDFFPFVLGLGFYFYERNRNTDIEYLEKEIKQRDKDIEKNASFAQKIGEGEFDASFTVEDDDDLLGRSLLIMRDNIRENNKKEAEQNWISAGKDKISDILRMYNNLEQLSYEVLVEIIKYINVVQGAIYLYEEERGRIVNYATYAYNRKKYINQEFKIGEGLIGQCAFEKDIIYRTEIPEDYVSIHSGILGDRKPSSLIIVPLIADEKLQGVMEFASIQESIPELTLRFVKELGEIIARTFFNLSVNQRTEKLLMEAQQMTEELQENEEELRQNAEEMRATHEELEKSNIQLEAKIQEVENAQKRQHSLLENASEIISIYDKDTTLRYISPSVTKILGYTPEEMMSGKDFDRLTRKGEAALNNLFEVLLNESIDSQSIQYSYMKKDGQKIFLEVTGRNLLKDPAINGIILNSQDITERKRAEKEERMRSKMQSLSENSLDMILRLNTTGQFFYANPVVENFTGINPKDIINQTLNTLKLDENLLEYFKDTIKIIKKTQEKMNSELTISTPNGELIMSINAIPEYNESELETILFVGHDITEAKRIEREIQDKNRAITESINYAQRIQTSILPNNKLIQEYLPKSFIFYKPRDVVSGDFPWFFPKKDEIYIAAVDCTGHGVPGALLSFIGYFILNNIVDHDTDYSAGEICDKLHFGVRKTLRQDSVDADARDGMDIALVKINLKENKIQYSGAHRPLYLLRKGELQEFKGDRKAIGGIPHRKKAEKNFTNYSIDIQKGDKIFFFSDGMPDQLGGPEKRKYSPKRIREAIVDNSDMSMVQYANYFAKDFHQWQGEQKQIDDVLLIGIEF